MTTAEVSAERRGDIESHNNSGRDMAVGTWRTGQRDELDGHDTNTNVSGKPHVSVTFPQSTSSCGALLAFEVQPEGSDETTLTKKKKTQLLIPAHM